MSQARIRTLETTKADFINYIRDKEGKYKDIISTLKNELECFPQVQENAQVLKSRC